MDKRLGVLIDGDNVPSMYITEMMEEITKYGIPTIKRIYGDWTKPHLNKWKNLLLENAITPIQQYAYTTGKNATDSAMIIDAMDLLYSNNIDGFSNIAFPIVRRVFGGLIANDLVSIQPMSLPSGLLFYLDYSYGQQVGGEDAGADSGTNGDIQVTATTLATTVGPLSVSADMFDEDDSTTVTTTGGRRTDSGDNRSVTVSLAAPIGDANLALDDSGDVTLSGTWSGVTLSHTMSDDGDSTTGSASIAGMDVSLTNDDGSTTWSIGTTVAGTAVTLDSDANVTATFGVTGNTVVVTHTSERASTEPTNTTTHYNTSQKDAFTTIAISRDLTSGAAISATYDSFDDALTLKASVAF